MKICIPTFGCDLKSGMSRYITNLLTQFSRIEGADTFHVIAHESAIGEYLSDANGRAVDRVHVAEWLANPILNVAWHQTMLPIHAKLNRYDVLFLPAASRRTPYWCPCPTVGTIHDLSPFHIKGKYDPARTFYQQQVLTRLLRELNHIIAISESTKQDIQQYIGIPDDRITVIHHAADNNTFYPREKSHSLSVVQKRYAIRSPYIVYTSRIEHPGKNHIRLIEAFEVLRREKHIPHQLVLAGSDWNGATEVHQVAQNSEFAGDILLTGYVPGDMLPHLYCGAELLAFPSLFEGFGLPVLEAMSCGTPVACSNLSSLPEIAGDAALLFDPCDIDSIATSIYAIIAEGDCASRLSRAGLRRAAEFSWAKTAAITLDVIHRTAAK